MKAIVTLSALEVICLLTLAACTNVGPFDYQAADEIPSGPGLVSGSDGAFVLFRRGVKDDESGTEKLKSNRERGQISR